jgi:PAS domain-containing protein
MRDDHRPKHELIHEITGLRKQVVDLKDAMMARRRVEDALREREGIARALADGAPVGLGLFRTDGTLLAVNRSLASMLGYDSPADLMAIAPVLGVFATAEEQSSTLNASGPAPGRPRRACFRTKAGFRQQHTVLAARPAEPEQEVVALAVFDVPSDTLHPIFLAPSA